MAVLGRPQRVAAAERANRVLGGLAVPLDAIARLAARQTGVPMAAVCLVAGEEILVGRYGLPPELSRNRRVPLAYSAGKYVVCANAPVLVPDMDAEPEYRRHALRVQLGLRAFAGVPLHDSAGEAVGSIVAGDVTTHQWTDQDLAGLLNIAEVLDRVPVRTTTDVAPPALDATALLDMVAEAFVAVDADGRIVGWNHASQRLFGWSSTEAVGQRLDRLLLAAPSDRLFEQMADRRLEAPAGAPVRGQGLARHRDGHPIPVEVVSHPLTSPHGPIICDFVVDLSRAPHDLADQDRPQRFLDAVLDSLRPIVVACDSDANVVLLNRAARDFFGLPDDWRLPQLSGLMDAVRYPDGTPMRADQTPLMRALRGEEVRDALTIIVSGPQRRQHAFVVNAQPIVAPDGTRLGAVAALHNVTEQRQLERFRTAEIELVRGLAYAVSVPAAGQAALAALAGALGWPYGELWLADDGLLKQIVTWSAPGTDHAELARSALRPGQGVAGRACQEGRLCWLPDLAAAGHPTLADAAGRAG